MRQGFDIPNHPRRGVTLAKSRCARAISILETTIAIGILGIGMIMVAAVFPVALSQHRDTTDLSCADELLSKADSMLRSRLDEDTLWNDPTLPAGEDSPWYLLPSANLSYMSDVWSEIPTAVFPLYSEFTSYANAINGVTESDIVSGTENLTLLTGVDTLSDRRAPFTAADTLSPFTEGEFRVAARRMAWYGFYQRRANGSVNYAVAVCRQLRDQLFARQDLGENTESSMAIEAQNPYSTPLAVYGDRTDTHYLPVPWRVSVGYCSSIAPRMLFNTQNSNTDRMLGPGQPLGVLAPRGSKIMIHGAVHQEPPAAGIPEVSVPAGRILTVANVVRDADGFLSIIEVTDDITDLPCFDAFGDGSRLITFDVWIFPPPLIGTQFGNTAPVIEWKLFL